MGEGKRLLVVDDSIVIVESLESILKLSGYSVDTAYSGSEALRKIQNNDYDLAICDIEMPGLSGLEFLSKVKKDYDSELDVILMTGYLERDYFINAIRLGASDFIRKPIDTKQLINSIRELMFRKSERQDFVDFYSNLENASFKFEMSAKGFSKYGVSKVFHTYLRHYFRTNPKVMNELLICLDEMVYNAYIHGSLKLTLQERNLCHEELRAVIDGKLAKDKIANKKVMLQFDIDNKNNMIEIRVSDEGDGFDYKNWMERIKDEPFLDIESHGRGLSLLYHLCESLHFEDGGSTVIVKKNLNNTCLQ